MKWQEVLWYQKTHLANMTNMISIRFFTELEGTSTYPASGTPFLAHVQCAIRIP